VMKIELSEDEIDLILDCLQGIKDPNKTEEAIQLERDYVSANLIAQLP